MDKTIAVACVLCLAILAVALSSASWRRTAAMEEMVKAGANPMAVACAMDGVTTSNQMVCITLAGEK